MYIIYILCSFDIIWKICMSALIVKKKKTTNKLEYMIALYDVMDEK